MTDEKKDAKAENGGAVAEDVSRMLADLARPGALSKGSDAEDGAEPEAGTGADAEAKAKAKAKAEAGVVRLGIVCDDAHLPAYGHAFEADGRGDAGMDCRAARRVKIASLKTKKVPLGIRLSIPAGMCVRIVGRSGLSCQGVLVHPLLVDSNFTGEVQAVVTNVSRKTVTFEEGDRVCQLITHRAPRIELNRIDESGLPDTVRGEAGYGSTGIR